MAIERTAEDVAQFNSDMKRISENLSAAENNALKAQAKTAWLDDSQAACERLASDAFYLGRLRGRQDGASAGDTTLSCEEFTAVVDRARRVVAISKEYPKRTLPASQSTVTVQDVTFATLILELVADGAS